MIPNDLGADYREISQEILGYLNFSSGAPDPEFLASLNALFGRIEDSSAQEDPSGQAQPVWKTLGEVLRDRLTDLHAQSDTFRQIDQAQAVLRLVFDETLPGFLGHHRDLLFHQTEQYVFRPLFIGRVCEAVLRRGGPWDQTGRIVAGALNDLNDFLGHRPVAVLETQQKIQPYDHERVRPIPLYIAGVGVAVGRYHDVIERALAILDATDSNLLFQAWFEPDSLDELAVDPRAYDFEHPANRRPNHIFGQWDLDHLDNSGRCRRYVLQQVTLDALSDRVENPGELSHAEALFEAAAVLAGTMLMGSGVSGNRPDSHHSDVTLATLVQQIAGYRDAFYERLLDRMTGPHGERLRAEAQTLQQPFGGARQHFNQYLARHRTRQLHHVYLARLFARLGHTEAAARQVRVVPVASARMLCNIHCRLTTAERDTRRGDLDQAAQRLPPIEALLHRAIECGAVIDPWNLLGFGGQYSLFPAVEDSIYDHRVDELLELIGRFFSVYVQIQKEAAATGNDAVESIVAKRLVNLTDWWDRFATTEVASIQGISGRRTRESADRVATALRAWQEAGTAAGDVAFWREHVEQFHSPKSYALVVEALLQKGDLVAAMVLLIQWLSRAEDVSPSEENYSFYDLASRWMEDVWGVGHPGPGSGVEPSRRWPLACKFLDFLEANAEEYWQVPRFDLAGESVGDHDEEMNPEEGAEPGDNSDDLFSAAYEGVTYRDSTDDGFEGEMLEGGADPTDFELVGESDRIVGRLTFLSTLARLWKLAAVASMPDAKDEPLSDEDVRQRDAVLAGWLAQASSNHRRLTALLGTVHRFGIEPPDGTHEAMVEYDQRRSVKEALLEEIIGTCVETSDTARMIRCAMTDEELAEDFHSGTKFADWEEPAVVVLRGALRGDIEAVRSHWVPLIDTLLEQPLLYVALARGGSPQRIAISRSVQGLLYRLLGYLPRLGLLFETSQLIETIQEMELDHPAGPGSVTDFHQMFRTGYQAIIRCLVVSSEAWDDVPRDESLDGPRDESPDGPRDESPDEPRDGPRDGGEPLVDLLAQATEALRQTWLMHSQGVRLSVLETIGDAGRWRELKGFVQRYGADLFTQRFMTFGNLSAILHQGAGAYIEALEEDPRAKDELRLLEELDGPLSREDAIQWLSITIEAVVENYVEYIDYNNITTQSDRGEMLYTLLDFLRLRAVYDREAWNLQPLVLTHQVLVQCGRQEAAVTWQEAMAQQSAKRAAGHIKHLVKLCGKYGMRLPSIAGRLEERFVRPMAIDRLRALVRPAFEQHVQEGSDDAFDLLEAEAARFAEELSGAGFDIPAWLEALEEEVENVLAGDIGGEEAIDLGRSLPQVLLSWEQAQLEIDAILGQDDE